MKKSLLAGALATAVALPVFAEFNPYAYEYTPSEEIKKSQKEFAEDRFGIFLHWGIYSMFAQGEWYLNYDVLNSEYEKAAKGFYPADFDADAWVKAIKDAGAKYICFTTRHHDGFSMFDTAMSDYDIIDASPFKRDILKELSEACQKHGIKLHLYYSHLDWGREDYPRGRTGKTTGRKGDAVDWPHYYDFMNGQIKELLTNYGPIRAIWFDGWWDHDEDPEPFDWRLDEQYRMIHELSPSTLIGNNHHQNPFPGEDIQIFERDLPGENTAGYSEQDISLLPLETCDTMNGMWGYKVKDTDYKDTETLIHYIVKSAGLGANLLLNIGPQPNGELPEVALQRLKDIGEWMNVYGETVYATKGSDFKAREWGTTTKKDNRIFVHILDTKAIEIEVPLSGKKVKKASVFKNGDSVKYRKTSDGVALDVSDNPGEIDYIIELELK